MKFKRINLDKNHMDGFRFFRNLGMPIATEVAMVADGMSKVEILAAYPDIEGEDIREILYLESF
jgi:uncharacterized protein (DUF433 family)